MADRGGMSDGAIRVLVAIAALTKRDGKYHELRRKAIIAEAGIADRWLGHRVADLESAGLLDVRRSDKVGGEPQPHRYRVTGAGYAVVDRIAEPVAV